MAIAAPKPTKSNKDKKPSKEKKLTKEQIRLAKIAQTITDTMLLLIDRFELTDKEAIDVLRLSSKGKDVINTYRQGKAILSENGYDQTRQIVRKLAEIYCNLLELKDLTDINIAQWLRTESCIEFKGTMIQVLAENKHEMVYFVVNNEVRKAISEYHQEKFAEKHQNDPIFRVLCSWWSM